MGDETDKEQTGVSPVSKAGILKLNYLSLRVGIVYMKIIRNLGFLETFVSYEEKREICLEHLKSTKLPFFT